MKRMLIKLASAAMLLSPVQVLAEETQTISVLQKIQDLFNQEKEQGFAETLGIKIYVDTVSTYRTKYFKNGLEGLESLFTDLCNENHVDPDLALAVCLNETAMGTSKECKENYNFGIPSTPDEPVKFEDKASGMKAFIEYLALTPEEIFDSSADTTVSQNTKKAEVTETTPKETVTEKKTEEKEAEKTGESSDEKDEEDDAPVVTSVEQISFKYKEIGFTDTINKLVKTIQEGKTE